MVLGDPRLRTFKIIYDQSAKQSKNDADYHLYTTKLITSIIVKLLSAKLCYQFGLLVVTVHCSLSSPIKNSLPWLKCEYVCGYELVVIYLLASCWRRLVRWSLQEIAVCDIYAHHHVTGASVSSQQMIYYRLCGATQVTPATAITDSLEIYWYFADSWFYLPLCYFTAECREEKHPLCIFRALTN